MDSLRPINGRHSGGRHASGIGETGLLLSLDQACQIEKFRRDLYACKSDTERYELCIRERDVILEKHTGLQLFIATLEQVMLTECNEYKRWKENRAKPLNPSIKMRLNEEDITQWEKFIGVVEDASKVKHRCLTALKSVAFIWKREMVEYYQLGHRGVKYCETASAAAKVTENLDEAIIKLNRIMLRRHQLPGRRHIRHSINPIEQGDFVNLKSWPHKNSFIEHKGGKEIRLPYDLLAAKEIPEGFTFDKFGLMVRAAVLSNAKDNVSLNPQILSLTNNINNSESSTLTGTEIDDTTLSSRVNDSSDHTSNFDEETENSSNSAPLSPISSFNETPSQSSTPFPKESTNSLPELGKESTFTAKSVVNESLKSGDIVETSRKFFRQRAKNPPKRDPPTREGRNKLTSHHPKPKRLHTGSLYGKRCCPEVSDTLLGILNQPSKFGAQFLAHFDTKKLCRPHLQKFVEAFQKVDREKDKMEMNPTENGFSITVANQKIRRHSLSDASRFEPFSKKKRLHEPAIIATSSATANHAQDIRPKHEKVSDEDYRRQILVELDTRLQKEPSATHGYRTNRLIQEILLKSQQPNLDTHVGELDALFLTGDEAAARVESGDVPVPIITEGQQSFRWSSHSRPISQLFQRMDYPSSCTVSVQIPSRPATQRSCRRRKLAEVQSRFVAQQPADDPWNVLDLRSPLPPSVLPHFLGGENCQLLLRVRDAVLMGNNAERMSASVKAWNEWRDILEWVLLAEGGNNTAPHMDSHGMATWITVQEGRFGFGWMARPTEDERENWIADPQHVTSGRWRYVVLSPGQTVFFNSGTVHFVFRIRGEQTLALGGHVLLWSGISEWVRVVTQQVRNPCTTNEDVEQTAAKYMGVVKGLVEARVRSGRVTKLDGDADINHFFLLVEEFKKEFGLA